MKLYAPKYYRRFRCIADRCEHNCCTDWEIDIDSETLQKYKALEGGYGDAVKDSISMDGTPHFSLKEGDRCPHLDERGLCKIICHLGEGYLCDICREHPRFYNYTEVAEVGIGMSCPEAARVILSAADYMTFEEIGKVDGEAEDLPFDGRAERQRVYELLGDSGLSYQERIDQICALYEIEKGEDAVWQEQLSQLEYLDEGHKALFLQYSSAFCPNIYEAYLERFLAYLVFRHCTEAIDREDFSVRLRFCLFLEALLTSLLYTQKAETPEEIEYLARVISEEIEYSEDNTFTLIY